MSNGRFALLLTALVANAASAQQPTGADVLERLGLAAWRIGPIVGDTPDTAQAEAFTFLVGGHLYGDPKVAAAGVSPTFGAKVEDLSRGSDRFFVSLGDFTYSQGHVRSALATLGKLRMPVFNAPGNHEWRPELYRRAFGKDYGCFVHGRNLFIVLNSEIDPWFIQGAQLDMLRAVTGAARASKDINRVFIFTHKLVWAAGDDRYRIVFKNVNGRDNFLAANNFAGEVAPLLDSLGKNKEVFWFSGDVGISWSYPLFFDRHPKRPVVYAAVGVGNRDEDCLLRVRVPARGPVAFDLVPLSNKPPTSLEACGLEFWRKQFPKSRHVEMLPFPGGIGSLPGPVTWSAPDEDRNGVADRLLFRVPVTITKPGRFLLTAQVWLAGGDATLIRSKVSNLDPARGGAVLELEVPAETLSSRAAPGPAHLGVLHLQAHSPETVSEEAKVGFACVTDYLRPRNFSTPVIRGPEAVAPGDTCRLELSAPLDPGCVYLAAASLGTNPGIPLSRIDPDGRDPRILPLNADALFLRALRRDPALFSNLAGTLDAHGEAQVTLRVPRFEGLKGTLVHVAYVVLDPRYPLHVRAISKPHAIFIR